MTSPARLARRVSVPFLPTFLDLRGKAVVVVGGEASAAAKALGFSVAGARVRLFSPCPGPEALALAPAVRVCRRGWLASDLHECSLVCAGPSLSDAAVERLKSAADAVGAMFYAVDRPRLSAFSSGAMVLRGGLSIAISSAGIAPALGQALRRDIERLLPDGIADYLDAAASMRAPVGARVKGLARRRFWADAADAAMRVLGTDSAPAGFDAWRHWLERRLEGTAGARQSEFFVLVAPEALDDLTLGQARALSRADVALVGDDASPACLSLLRREAQRLPLSSVSDVNAWLAGLAPGSFVVALVGPGSADAARGLAAVFADIS